MAQLLKNLAPYLLYTDVQRNTYNETPVHVKRQSVMDHFERCFSIFKLPKNDLASHRPTTVRNSDLDLGVVESSPPLKKMKSFDIKSSGEAESTTK